MNYVGYTKESPSIISYCPGIRGLERGVEQHAWECKRYVIGSSSVCCTVDGYNFYTDLLRMYGNSVVEQVAEKAFIELMQKQLSK